MASGYLHKVLAEQAAKDAAIHPLVKETLVLGAQGPDPLFTIGIFPLSFKSRPAKYGNVLHTTRTGAFLTALLQRAKDRGDAERSFAMGFLTHYALDSVVHPYVYAHSYDKNGKYSSPIHMTLEKHWDALYYQRDGGRGTPVFMPGIIEAKPHWQAIAALWHETMREVYPEQDLTQAAIVKAFEDAARVNSLTHSNTGIKYGIVWALERIVGKPQVITSQITPRYPSRDDIENTQRRPWRSAAEPSIERTEGLTELFAAARARAEALLSAAQRYYAGDMSLSELSELIGNVGYDTGATSLP